MTTALEVDPNELVERAAKQLQEKNLVQPPKWASYVKTGMHVERPPVRTDWWYVRAAAVLRSIYKLAPIGTNKLRTKYGGRKNRGYRPEHFYRGGGSIIRKILQQLEKAGFLEQVQKGAHKGRKLTNQGKSFLDKIAAQIAKEPVKERKKKLKTFEVKIEAAPIEEKKIVGPEGERLKKKG